MTNQLKEFFDSFFLRDILLNTDFGFVKGNLTATCTDVTIVSVSHFTRTIHNTTHDADFQPYEIFCGSLDAGDSLLKIV